MISNLCKKMFPKSLWLFHTNCGACNGCDIEVIDVLTPYYDVERFGMKLVGSPRHADALIVSGSVSRPEAIVYGAAQARGLVPKKVSARREQHLPPGFDAEEYLKGWTDKPVITRG